MWRENKSGCITSFLTNHSSKIWIVTFSRLRFTKYGYLSEVSSSPWLTKSIEFYAVWIYAFLCLRFWSQRLIFSISFRYLHFIREFAKDFCSLFVSSRARFLQTRIENMASWKVILSWVAFHADFTEWAVWRVDCLLSLSTLQLSDSLSKRQMASRCISTLNDLDRISDRIYYKHSKVKKNLYEGNGKVR